eukprot:767341-Hanusia_phi.AAC.4
MLHGGPSAFTPTAHMPVVPVPLRPRPLALLARPDGTHGALQPYTVWFIDVAHGRNASLPGGPEQAGPQAAAAFETHRSPQPPGELSGDPCPPSYPPAELSRGLGVSLTDGDRTHKQKLSLVRSGSASQRRKAAGKAISPRAVEEKQAVEDRPHRDPGRPTTCACGDCKADPLLGEADLPAETGQAASGGRAEARDQLTTVHRACQAIRSEPEDHPRHLVRRGERASSWRMLMR